jgi:uncharacterized OB-fold protein
MLHPGKVLRMGYDKPLPKINPDNKAFWEGCARHELKFQKCASCSHVIWPASIICPECHSREMEWISSKGHGTIYTYAVYHAVYHPGFAGDIPYVVAIVELDEGPHLLTNIVGCKSSEVECGLDVCVVWDDITPDVSLPKFRINRR